jgi:hypothetical protein
MYEIELVQGQCRQNHGHLQVSHARIRLIPDTPKQYHGEFSRRLR